MAENKLKLARALTDEGFYYDNLIKMANYCRDERDPAKLLAGYVLEKVFMDLAEQVGEGPIIMNTLRKIEAKYRTSVNLALEKSASSAPPEEQREALSKVISLLRD
jgi:hypothetical protein